MFLSLSPRMEEEVTVTTYRRQTILRCEHKVVRAVLLVGMLFNGHIILVKMFIIMAKMFQNYDFFISITELPLTKENYEIFIYSSFLKSRVTSDMLAHCEMGFGHSYLKLYRVEVVIILLAFHVSILSL